MKHAIVTGGTGVPGVALIRYLLQKDTKVTALIRKNSQRKGFLPQDDNLIIIECNLEEMSCVSKRLEGNVYDAFFHLGWDASSTNKTVGHWNDMNLQNRNIGYALDAVELCSTICCPLFIATGSQAEYGCYDIPVTEETPVNPQNGYAFAKVCAYNMTKIMCRNYGIKYIWARLFSVYGPYDAGRSLLGSSLFKLLRGEQIGYTEGNQIWNYLYSFDAAEALYLLMKHGRDGEVYCIANETSTYLKDYIQVFHRLINSDILPRFGEVSYRKEQVMYMASDISKLKKDTGFSPKYSFEQGVTAMRDWALKEYNGRNI